jgi:hypothetical protein
MQLKKGNMRTNCLLILLTLSSCQKAENIFLPSFNSNSSLKGEYRVVKDILESRDFCVTIFQDTELSEKHAKILCLKDTMWEKIEIVDGLFELDTLLKKDDAIFVGKKVQLTKVTPKKEALYFLEKLKKYGLFELPEEKELYGKCKQDRADHDVPEYSDVGITNIIITKGDEVRKLSYDTYKKKEDCPTLTDTYNRIDSIERLFENEWYVKKHY